MASSTSYSVCFASPNDEKSQKILVFLDKFVHERHDSTFRDHAAHEATIAHLALSLSIIAKKPSLVTHMIFRDAMGTDRNSNCHMFTTCGLLVSRAQFFVRRLHDHPGVRALPRCEYKTDKTASPVSLLTDAQAHVCLMDFARLVLVPAAPVAADMYPEHPCLGRDALLYNQLLLMCAVEMANLSVDIEKLCGSQPEKESSRLGAQYEKVTKRVTAVALVIGVLDLIKKEEPTLPGLEQWISLAHRRLDECRALQAFALRNKALARSLLSLYNSAFDTLAVEALARVIFSDDDVGDVPPAAVRAHSLIPRLGHFVFDGPLPAFLFCRPEKVLRDSGCHGAHLPRHWFPEIQMG